MRPKLLKVVVMLMACSPWSTTVADAAVWSGSYAAQGQCFCVGEIPAAIRSSIVPTPVGGQTVAQICKRLGEGPGLHFSGGVFNYPVYTDAQCGNGTQAVGFVPASGACAGSLDGKGESSQSCQPAGPRWDLTVAFSRARAPAAALPADPETESSLTRQSSSAAAGRTSLLVTPGSGNSSLSLLGKPDVGSMSQNVANATTGDRNRTVQVAVVGSRSAARQTLSDDAALPPFTGKTVTIDGQRYLQARTGFPASGGEAGSRIILDDLVYLLDDGNIDPADLFRTRPVDSQSKSAEQKKASTPAQKQSEPAESASEPAKKQLTTAEKPPKPVEKPSSAAKIESKRTPTPGASTTPGFEQSSNVPSSSRPNVAKVPSAARPSIAELEAEQARELVDPKQLEIAKAKLQQESALRARATIQARLAEQKRMTAELEPELERELEPEPEPEPVIESNVENPAKSAPTRDTELVEQQRNRSVVEAASQVKPGSAETADAIPAGTGTGFIDALRLPASVRASSRQFDYLEAMPVAYDVGGNGVMLEGSGSSQSRFHFIGRVGVTGDYQEVMAGGGYYLTPVRADRLTLVLLAGVEYGTFALIDEQAPGISVDFSDSGLYVGAASRLVINNRFELKAGLAYSSFFEGDAMLFGGGYYHVTPRLDLVTRFEIGDNDLLGIGVRFYY